MTRSSNFRKSLLGLVLAGSVIGVPALADAQPVDIIVVDSDPVSGLNVADLAPGDTTEWAVEVRNVSGRQVPVSAIYTTDVDDPATPLTTDPVDGLWSDMRTCSQPWTPGTAGPENARVFTCEGTETVVLAETPVAALIGDPFGMTSDLAVNGSLHIRAKIRFPASAGNDFENLAGALRIEFNSEYSDPPEPDPDPETPTSTTTPGTTTPTDPSSPPTTTPGPGPSEPGEPGKPGSPSEPGTPGQPGRPDEPGFPWKPPLPRTGSDLLGVLSVGIAAVLAGSILRSAAQRRSNSRLLADLTDARRVGGSDE